MKLLEENQRYNNLLQAKQQDSANMLRRLRVSWISTRLQRILRVGKNPHNWVHPLTKHHLANQTGALSATAHFLNTSSDVGSGCHLPGQPVSMLNHSFWEEILLEFIFFSWYWCNEKLMELTRKGPDGTILCKKPLHVHSPCNCFWIVPWALLIL